MTLNGKPRETIKVEGEVYVKVPTTGENIWGGWVRFRDVIVGAHVDVLVEQPEVGRWVLVALRVKSSDGIPITGADLKNLRVPTLIERAKEARTWDMEAISQRSRREQDKDDRMKAVRKLLTEMDEAGRPHVDAVRILIHQNGVSRAGAYRWITQAKGEDK